MHEIAVTLFGTIWTCLSTAGVRTNLSHEAQQRLVLAAAMIAVGIGLIALPDRWERALNRLHWGWEPEPGLRSFFKAVRIVMGILCVLFGVVALVATIAR